jgi:hypothetical protein
LVAHAFHAPAKQRSKHGVKLATSMGEIFYSIYFNEYSIIQGIRFITFAGFATSQASRATGGI